MVAPTGVISSRPSSRKGYCSAALASRPKDIAEVRDTSVDREHTMPDDRDDHDNVVVRGQDGRRSNARESVIFLSRASKQHELALGHSPGGSGRG